MNVVAGGGLERDVTGSIVRLARFGHNAARVAMDRARWRPITVWAVPGKCGLIAAIKTFAVGKLAQSYGDVASVLGDEPTVASQRREDRAHG